MFRSTCMTGKVRTEHWSNNLRDIAELKSQPMKISPLAEIFLGVFKA
ncbi:putative protein OS=Eoetvoesiella caeni OX=645616 GN=DFR37_103318 PE=4 SV=1 [Eoetvoesiella caeni]|uniref:Uncharacterized protein n=1 Tax=Eoetvoesiella caeni TaxID=645616 RepID=A0A366HG58_9BURK|nr:hypothetical protein DFR37_103318 [Eoetvoesiella caeni]